MRRVRRVGLVVLAGAIAGIAWAIASGAVGRAWMAVRILDDLRRPGAASLLDRTTTRPNVTETWLAGDTVAFAADVYRAPQGGGRVPLLLVPGAVELGKDDPRIAPFAETLARAGFTVVVPDLPSMRTLEVRRENPVELAAAHAALCARPDLAPERRAGLFGISYAGGVALLVALDPAAAPRVAYVAAVGAPADLDSSVRFLATGRVADRGGVRRVKVDPYGAYVFVRTIQRLMKSDEDRRLLDAIVTRRFQDLDADISDLAARLGREGRTVVDLFEGGDEARLPALMAMLPSELHERIELLSPARRDFARLRAPLYLIHARDDGTFPVTESERLTRLARPHVPVLFVVLDALQHVEPEPWSQDLIGFVRRDLPEAARLAAWWTVFLAER